MRRTITAAAAILLVILGVGLMVYYLFFAGSAGVTITPTGGSSLPTTGQNISPTEGGGDLATPAGPVTVTARLVKISEGPVVPGEVVTNTFVANSSETTVNYIERQSGNVFSYNTSTGLVTRTSNKTVPGIQSAAWLPSASTAFVRYLSGEDFSTINTYALPSNGSGGFFLPQNLLDIAVSQSSVLTLASGVNGSIVSTELIDGTNSSPVFTSPLSSLRISFAGENQYLAFTNPSSTLPGDAFLVRSGHFSRVAGPLYGLNALASHSGEWVLVCSTAGNTLQMELVRTSTGETVSLPVATIADKCVWTADDSAIYCGIPENPSSNYTYPDDWYQGAVSFSDRIWKIDVAGRYAQLVFDFPKETDASLDAKALAIDPLDTELVFMNKIDGSLWGYAL